MFAINSADIAIFEDGNDFYWYDWLNDDDIKNAKYFVDRDNEAGVHSNIKSGLYDDMTGYVDELQNEEDLADGELYVVCYFKLDDGCCALDQYVDFGITKQEIIDNVKNQKYVEGANYFTMGHMFYTTSMVMKEIEEG